MLLIIAVTSFVFVNQNIRRTNNNIGCVIECFPLPCQFVYLHLVISRCTEEVELENLSKLIRFQAIQYQVEALHGKRRQHPTA